MRIPIFCFGTAALAALAGMSLGIFMGIRQDFTLAPVHAHINLLGWVTMALYGLYHRGAGRGDTRLGWAQVGCGAAGFPLMTGGLAYEFLTGDTAFLWVISAGALLSLAGMALFLAVVVRDAGREGAGAAGGQPSPGW